MCQISRPRIIGLLALVACSFGSTRSGLTHDGPDPIAHWSFSSGTLKDGTLRARLGPDGRVVGAVEVARSRFGESITFPGQAHVILADDFKSAQKYLPKRHLTVSAWVSVDERQARAGVVGVIQTRGDTESGWLVGYDERHFRFRLSTHGTKGGNGQLTDLAGKTIYEPGGVYHVVATYDGQTMELYVNGKLDGTSSTQSGDIRYPVRAPFVIGAYPDADKTHFHRGRLHEIAIYDRAAKQEWVQHDFAQWRAATRFPPHQVAASEQEIVVNPYLQFVTQTSIVVMWQTAQNSNSVVRFGGTSATDDTTSVDELAMIHEVRLTGLKPETQYFYRVESTDADGKKVESDVYTFQTANHERTPFGFAVISDTQSNPKVANQIAKLAWSQRPQFMIHPGDLVGTGSNDGHWTQQFFPSMAPLISRVAFFPVLGNHEGNASNYYEYMSLPEPEYYYDFRYGNAHFFMIDSNKNVGPDSEQFKWLDRELGQSTATWKFVCHHHPPYSSDENDYGDLWKTNQSTHGDLRVRELTQLYGKHQVDIVWCGHIHSYERTWPLRDNRAVESQGTIYMITGGGGGSLETPGPTRTWFQNNVRYGHHYCMVAINGNTLEFRAFDVDDRLFDSMKIVKP